MIVNTCSDSTREAESEAESEPNQHAPGSRRNPVSKNKVEKDLRKMSNINLQFTHTHTHEYPL